ncbi:MAG: type I methionyl aminopeptidase [Anaerolineaceae bacterium]|nr:type I methionyl aminopeptidase [Anaerolineaceae bacterium]
MITIKKSHEIKALRKSARLVTEILEKIQDAISPGVSLVELDELVAEQIKEVGAEPLYKGYKQSSNQPPFPGIITTSLNQEVCHGIPNARILKKGDILSIDIGLRYEGWCGDTCVTLPVGGISKEAQDLIDATRKSLAEGIQAAKSGSHLSDIGAAIEAFAKKQGYGVVREYGGHSIGKELHESFVPHTGPGGRGPILEPGMVLNIEPMLNIGKPSVKLLSDGWTVVTTDGSLSAQFEQTIVITKNGPDILNL